MYKYGIYILNGVCAAIEQLLPVRPLKKLKDLVKGLILHQKGPRQTSKVVLRGCFALIMSKYYDFNNGT